MKVIKDFKNKLLKRNEVEFMMSSDGNPGFLSTSKQIIEHFKATDDRIVVKSIKSKFGSKDFLVEAFIYDAAADKMKTEPKKKEKAKKEGQ